MMKRTMGGVLAAAMMMMSALPAAGAVDVSHLNGTGSSTLTQAAADTLPSLSVAPMTELATVVSYENGDLTVKTADGDELVLHTENAIVMDTQTAAAADLSALKAGESVYVYHDEAVTMSLPAQTTAYAVLTNLTDNTVVSALALVLDKANAAGKPVFGSEIEQVKLGCAAAEGLDYIALGRQTGLMAAKVLTGEAKASDMAYEVISDPSLYINSEALARFGIVLSDDLAARAIEAE